MLNKTFIAPTHPEPAKMGSFPSDAAGEKNPEAQFSSPTRP